MHWCKGCRGEPGRGGEGGGRGMASWGGDQGAALRCGTSHHAVLPLPPPPAPPRCHATSTATAADAGAPPGPHLPHHPHQRCPGHRRAGQPRGGRVGDSAPLLPVPCCSAALMLLDLLTSWSVCELRLPELKAVRCCWLAGGPCRSPSSTGPRAASGAARRTTWTSAPSKQVGGCRVVPGACASSSALLGCRQWA